MWALSPWARTCTLWGAPKEVTNHREVPKKLTKRTRKLKVHRHNSDQVLVDSALLTGSLHLKFKSVRLFTGLVSCDLAWNVYGH